MVKKAADKKSSDGKSFGEKNQSWQAACYRFGPVGQTSLLDRSFNIHRKAGQPQTLSSLFLILPSHPFLRSHHCEISFAPTLRWH